jgi:hypothetical protein
MAKKKHIFPPDFYIYICDYESDGTPIFATAQSLDEVEDGEVAIYTLASLHTKKTEHILE